MIGKIAGILVIVLAAVYVIFAFVVNKMYDKRKKQRKDGKKNNK